MLPLIYPLLLLSPNVLRARAAPAAADTASLSLNAITASNISTTLSLSDEATLTSLALFLNSSNPAEIVHYRVPNTHTILRIGLQDDAISKLNLGRTILRTQQSLASFIADYDAEDRPL
ncbi:MAG: hypothetical protein Q9175_007640, partial [Cornicularia normoerica]